MKEIRTHVEDQMDQAVVFLADILQYPSVSGEGEEAVQEHIAEVFRQFGAVEQVAVPEDLTQDPNYTFGDQPFDYSRRKNVVLRIPGTGGGRSLILNSHADVVRPAGWADAFSPRVEGNLIYARGACDAKGQIATIYLALLVLKALGIKLSGDLTVESVIEEEVGGNGALALIKQGYTADGAIVLEPTDLRVTPANRGAVWYHLEVEGKSVHMGKIWEGVNAIEKTCALMKELRKFEQKLIAESRGVPLFESYKQPVQLNFGTIHGDGWPASVCGKVVLEGGVGFLPNKAMDAVKREFEDAIRACGDPWTVSHYALTFPKLHNDAYGIPADHPLVQATAASLTETVGQAEVVGWIASCDGRLFNRVGGMPTVVFGPGKLEDAHSANEKIDLNQMRIAAEALVRTVLAWCGKE